MERFFRIAFLQAFAPLKFSMWNALKNGCLRSSREDGWRTCVPNKGSLPPFLRCFYHLSTLGRGIPSTQQVDPQFLYPASDLPWYTARKCNFPSDQTPCLQVADQYLKSMLSKVAKESNIDQIPDALSKLKAGGLRQSFPNSLLFAHTHHNPTYSFLPAPRFGGGNFGSAIVLGRAPNLSSMGTSPWSEPLSIAVSTGQIVYARVFPCRMCPRAK